MNANNTKIVITALIVVPAIAIPFLFNEQVSVDLTAPFVHLKLDGSNKSGSTAGVQGEDLKTQNGDINARDGTGKGVEVKRAETGTGSINLINEAPSGDSNPPKP